MLTIVKDVELSVSWGETVSLLSFAHFHKQMPTAIVVIAEPAEIHRSFLLLFCHTQKRDVILTTECLIAFKNTRPNFRHTEPPQSPLKSALAADASQHSEESLRFETNTSDVKIATRKSTVVFAFYT